MSRKQPKRTAGNVVLKAMAGVFICALICGVGFSVASADSSDDVARAGGLGFDEATQVATSSTQHQVSDIASDEQYIEQSALAATSARTIDASLELIAEKEEAERQRIAAEKEAERKRIEAEKEAERQRLEEERKRIEAENAAALERVAANMARQGVYASEGSAEGRYEYGLPAVDWTVGRQAFVEEWTVRIDSYLSGSALAGYGYAFAEAAWDNGVDPRWSPAISATESGRGSVCFLPCNAWGWGESSWGDWDSAIRAHVAGLANGYGYSITYSAASVYCPPNTDFWYSNTFDQMSWM
jgi:hypothetical protein